MSRQIYVPIVVVLTMVVIFAGPQSSPATNLDFQEIDVLPNAGAADYGSSDDIADADGILSFDTPNVAVDWSDTAAVHGTTGAIVSPWKNFASFGAFYGHDGSSLGMDEGGIVQSPKITFTADAGFQVLVESIGAYSYDSGDCCAGNVGGTQNWEVNVDGTDFNITVTYTGNAGEPFGVDFTSIAGYGAGSVVTLQILGFTGNDPQQGAWALDHLVFSQNSPATFEWDVNAGGSVSYTQLTLPTIRRV